MTQENFCIDSVLKHCAANRKRRISALPNVGPYIYDIKISGFTRSSIYRVSQEECARLREDVPYVKVYRYNPKHLCPKLNGYGDNGQKQVWSSSGSTHCTCQLTTLSMSVLECGVKWRPRYISAGHSCVMYSAWNPKDNYDMGASVFVVQFNGFMSQVSLMLSTDINITETTYSCQF